MRNKSILTLSTLLFTFTVSLFPFSKVMAQENGVYEINEKTEIGSDNNRSEFNELAFRLYPSHYIENNELKMIYGSGEPIKMNLKDFKSLDWLNNQNAKRDSIELLIINLENASDLQNKIDLSNNLDFERLKYILIKCKFKCTDIDIKQFVKTNSKVRVFYTNKIGG